MHGGSLSVTLTVLLKISVFFLLFYLILEEYTRDKKKFMKAAEEFTKKNGEKRPSD